MDDPGPILAFGRFELDTARGLLFGPDGEIRLRPKSYEVLRHLVRNPGRLVTRKELLDAVWGTTVVTDDSLSQCLVEIRRSLGDEGRHLVRTVPRRGYVFEGRTSPALRPRVASPEHAGGLEPPPARKPARRWQPLPAVVAAMAAAAAVLAWWGLSGRDTATPSGTDVAAQVLPNSIAVLPFVDMSAGRDQAHLGDGIAEEILNALAQSGRFKVIARTSSFAFREQPVDVRTIGRRLGVTYVLEGSVRTSGNRVRVIAQLIDTSDSSHLWSEDFDRELGDLFLVQSEIAASVAEALSSSGGPLESVVTPHNPKAYEHFLRGRYLFHRRAPGDIVLAQQHFEAAVALEPGYAEAWAALAGVYASQFGYRTAEEEPLFTRAEDAVARALALDPASVEGHLRAALLQYWRGNTDAVVHHVRIAEGLDPDNVLLLGNLAGYALARDDLATAIDLQQRTIERDPLSTVNLINLAYMLLAGGQLEEGRARALAARELNPDLRDEVDLYLAQALILEEKFGEALETLRGAPEGDERDAAIAIAAQALGREAESRAAVDRLRSRDTFAAAAGLAALETRRGDREAAWAWLETSRDRLGTASAYSAHRWRQLISSDALLGPLREDPRWAAIFEDSLDPSGGR